MHDFYYSETLENKLKDHAPSNYNVTSILINHTYYVYTEAVAHGKKPIDYGDNVFLGTANIKDVVHKDGVRKIVEYKERDCTDKVCQLCDLNCYIRVTVNK